MATFSLWSFSGLNPCGKWEVFWINKLPWPTSSVYCRFTITHTVVWQHLVALSDDCQPSDCCGLALPVFILGIKVSSSSKQPVQFLFMSLGATVCGMGGMKRYELCSQSLRFSRMKPWSGIRKRRKAGKKMTGFQRWGGWGWSYNMFKMRFSLIYLFSWTHSSRLSARFLLYAVSSVPHPSSPSVFQCWAHLQVQILYACMHIYTSTATTTIATAACVFAQY